jgi:hypothetical protein
VDRLTTGRRYARAGSVHVTELINKRAVRPGVPAPLASPAAFATRTRHAAEDPVVPSITPLEPVGPAHRRAPSSRGAQFAKLTSLGAATLVLCGAVAAASMISHERSGQQAATERPAVRITGDQALLPDQLDRTLPSAGGPRERPAGEPTPVPEPAGAPAVEPMVVAEGPTTSPAADPSGEPYAVPPSVAVPESDIALVRQFYDLLPSEPDNAFELLAPDVLSGDVGEFLESWSTVEKIEVVELHGHDEGVVAVVRMSLDDGSQMRVEQLLTVADSPHQITGAQLLSAQRN